MCLIVFCNAVFSQSTSKICTLIRFTLFSNESDIVKTLSVVLLPYRFTLFSNRGCTSLLVNKFYYLIDLHYSQTSFFAIASILLFYYLIDLHYSQTTGQHCGKIFQFYYLIDLHYSQTQWNRAQKQTWFYYLIDLHYSQTPA